MNLDLYFENHYHEIVQWAESIYKRSEIDPRDVVAELYIDLKMRELPKSTKEMKFYILRWLKSRTYWQGGNKIKAYKIKEHYQYDKLPADIIVYDMEQDEISADLNRAGFSVHEAQKIVSCIEASKGMPLYYKRLFVLYYIDGMTMEAIGKSCSLPKSAIYTQLLKVQKWLKHSLKLETQKSL